MTITREEVGKLKPVTKEDDERLIEEGKKEYMHGWYEENKEELNERGRQYYKEHKEGISEYYQEHKEEKKIYNKQYKEENKEKLKLSHAKYLQTEAGKIAMNRFQSKRRSLGSLTLNEPFEDSEAHHFNKEGVIYIPAELHRNIWHNLNTGQGMVEINNKVVEWLIDIGELMPLPR